MNVVPFFIVVDFDCRVTRLIGLSGEEAWGMDSG